MKYPVVNFSDMNNFCSKSINGKESQYKIIKNLPKTLVKNLFSLSNLIKLTNIHSSHPFLLVICTSENLLKRCFSPYSVYLK